MAAITPDDAAPTSAPPPPPPSGALEGAPDELNLAWRAIHGMLPRAVDEAALQADQRANAITDANRAVVTAVGSMLAPNLTRYLTEPPPAPPPPPPAGFVGKVPSDNIDPRAVAAGADVAQLAVLPFGGAEVRGAMAARTAEEAALARGAANVGRPAADAGNAAARTARTIEALRAPPQHEPPTGTGFLPAPKTAAEHIEDLRALAHDEAAHEAYWEDRVANVHPRDAEAELDRIEQEQREMLESLPPDVRAELEAEIERLEKKNRNGGH